MDHKNEMYCFFVVSSLGLFLAASAAYAGNPKNGQSGNGFVDVSGTHAIPSSQACHGDMGAYKIKHKVYECYYDHGFTGKASAGWDPNLQYAWSRIAAAEVCGSKKVDEEKLIKLLVKRFGQDPMVHRLVGIQFHKAQISADPGFCTPKRIRAVEAAMPKFYAGNFPELFSK